MAWNTLNNSKGNGERLDEMVQACRKTEEPTLSDTARTRILDEARRPVHADGLRALFTPTRHLLVAGTLPVVLAVALLIGLDSGVQTPPAGINDALRVAVSKEDGRITFSIQNGGRPHTVYRSTDPQGFDRESGVKVTSGAYEDRLQDQADLVFYRID
jgi:hypothetical protein